MSHECPEAWHGLAMELAVVADEMQPGDRRRAAYGRAQYCASLAASLETDPYSQAAYHRSAGWLAISAGDSAAALAHAADVVRVLDTVPYVPRVGYEREQARLIRVAAGEIEASP